MKLFAYQYFSSSSEGKLKTGEIFLILFFNKKHKHVWAKLRLGKLVCWCKRQKITCGKINLYAVLSLLEYKEKLLYKLILLFCYWN